MKKRAALGLAGLAAVAAIGGTWAYWNQNLSVANDFKAGNFDSDIVEKFKPEEDWLPGETVDKVVKVTNSGNVDMAVMATITQKWTEEGVVFETPEGDEYAAQIQWGDNVAMFAVPGLVDEAAALKIEKTVRSFADSPDTWVLTGINDMQDGSQQLCFVYSGIVKENGSTNNLVESVTMNPLIKSSVTDKVYTVGEDGTLSQPKETKSEFKYEADQYTMTINAKTVQATSDAVKEVFGEALSMEEEAEEIVINDFLDATELNSEKPVQ